MSLSSTLMLSMASAKAGGKLTIIEAGITNDNYRYEALYESSGPAPDFHRLSKFQPIDFKYLLPENKDSKLSATWETAIAEAKVSRIWHS